MRKISESHSMPLLSSFEFMPYCAAHDYVPFTNASCRMALVDSYVVDARPQHVGVMRGMYGYADGKPRSY